MSCPRDSEAAAQSGATVISLAARRRTRDPAPFPPEVVEWFVGEVPDLLTDIAENIERTNPGGVAIACRRLRRRALAVGGLPLARLCRACALLAADGDFSTAAAFSDLLEQEYAEMFSRLAGRDRVCP